MYHNTTPADMQSLSARRAWIEIGLRSCRLDCRPRSLSARRAWIEITFKPCIVDTSASLSARRAWIEIGSGTPLPQPGRVALRKESVDRNQNRSKSNRSHRSPLSARRAWIEMAGHPAHGLPRMGRSPQGERG